MDYQLAGWSWSRPFCGLTYLKRDKPLNGHDIWIPVDTRRSFSSVSLHHITVYHTEEETFFGGEHEKKAKKRAVELASTMK